MGGYRGYGYRGYGYRHYGKRSADAIPELLLRLLLMLTQMLLLKLILAMLSMEDTEVMEVTVWDMDMVTVSTMARGLLRPSLAMATEVMGMAEAIEAMDTVDTDTATVVR